MSLYQQYRPQTFADVCGQDPIVTTLEQAVAQDKIAHAYLFAGPRGTGKTSVARILSKHILTHGMSKAESEQLVRDIEDGRAVDLIEIDAASNRGIDDVRELIEKIQFSPIRAAAKVYIIDEVHMLTREAFNALLKTLEEPPAYAFFILATTELHKIPATIQSRCQRFMFSQVREEDIIRRLQFVADQEKIVIDRMALRSIAEQAAGGMRDALALLDQLRSLPKITVAEVEDRIGKSSKTLATGLLAAVGENDAARISELISEAEESGLSLEHLGRELLGLLRLSLHAALKDGKAIEPYVHMIEDTLEAIRDLRISPLPGVILEAALLRLTQAGAAAPLKDAARLFSEETPAPKKSAPKVEAPAPAPVMEQPKPTTKKAVAPETKDAIVEAPAVSLQEITKHWPAIVDKAKPASVKMSLKNGRPTKVEGMNIVVAFSSKFHRDRVAVKEASFAVEELLRDAFKQPVTIKCVLAQEENAAAIASEESVNLADIAKEVF